MTTALLLVGSPKGMKSASASLGTYLLDRLQALGLETSKLWIRPSLESPRLQNELLTAALQADIVILSCPLYVDSIPAPVIRAMELITNQRKAGHRRDQKLLAISNCGFPEAAQNDTALAMYRCFARQTGFEWLGGLAMGMGGAVGSQPLEALPGWIRPVRRALELTANALAKGSSVPPEAVNLMARPHMPRWVYTAGGNLGWLLRARSNKVSLLSMGRRPYS